MHRHAQADFAAGAVPPDFVIDRTLIQMAAITGTAPADSVMSQSLARRASGVMEAVIAHVPP